MTPRENYQERAYEENPKKRVIDDEALPWGTSNKYNLGAEPEPIPDLLKSLKELQENGTI